MSSARHKCNCDYCVEGRNAKKELQFGGTDWETDEETPVRYRRPKKRNRKVCSKSKTGEPCDRAGQKVKGTIRKYDYLNKEWNENVPRMVVCCSRCGREHWW